METLLQVKNLKKSYGKKCVVNDVSFEIREGEIFSLLGPNGAGKTTTINVICGALGYESGEILFKGEDINVNLLKFKENIGIVPQDIALYEELSALQNVKFFASLYNLKGSEQSKRVDMALERTGLLDKKNDRVSTFSGGMKRRLNIACAIAHEPKLIIMDEPTVGIDPQSRNHILKTCKDLVQNGAAILYTTHYMEEVETIADYITIMDHGNVIATGTRNDIIRSYSNYKEIQISVENKENVVIDEIRKLDIQEAILKDEKLIIKADENINVLDKVLAVLLAQKVSILEITTIKPNLEKVFLNITGRSLRD